MTEYGYSRYLAAKQSVDDRALNRTVLAELRRLLPAGAPRVVEVGAGLGMDHRDGRTAMGHTRATGWTGF